MNEYQVAPLCEAEDAQGGGSDSRELIKLHKALLDTPAHLRAISSLAGEERVQFWKAWDFLKSGGGVLALTEAGDMPLTGLGVYEALLARSWAIRLHDPGEMIHLSTAALMLAKSFNSIEYGERQVADLQARAWGELANAYRIADRFWEAKHAFAEAHDLRRNGTGDLYLKVRLFDLEASFLGTSREFDLALATLATLPEMYHCMGEPRLAGRALLAKALYTYYSCDLEEAICINHEALELLDPKRDQALHTMAVHNHLLFLVDLGCYSQARRMLFENRCHALYEQRIMAFRLRWIDGRINYGLRKLESAEIALREARDGLLEKGLKFHSALASLDLALSLMAQKKIDEAAAEVFVAQETFLSLEVYREFLGCVAFLEEAFRMRVATVDLLETTVAHIRRKGLQLLSKLG